MFGSLLGCRWWRYRVARTLLVLLMKGEFHGQVELCAFSIPDFCSQLPALVWGELGPGGGMVVRISATRETDAGAVVVRVSNPGRWVTDARPIGLRSAGVGLANLRDRLAARYGERYRFAHADGDGMVTVTVSLPTNGTGSGEGPDGTRDRREHP